MSNLSSRPRLATTLINGLNRAVGRLENTADEIGYEPARTYGNVFALHELWKDLGFDRALSRALRSGKRTIDVEALVQAMVFNRLCDPTSKLGCLRWLETVAMPAMPETVTHQHLLRDPLPGNGLQSKPREGGRPDGRYRGRRRCLGQADQAACGS